jgi:hypothetical protein
LNKSVSIEDRRKKGSLKWIQKLVIEKPTLLDSQIGNGFDLGASAKIEWLSPLEIEEYAEYCGGAFLKRLGIKLEDTLYGYVGHSRIGERITSLRFSV